MSNSNKPAYPVIHADANYERMANHGGLTKREMFAMAAMQGVLSNTDLTNHVNGFPEISKVLGYADALLKQLGE